MGQDIRQRVQRQPGVIVNRRLHGRVQHRVLVLVDSRQVVRRHDLGHVDVVDERGDLVWLRVRRQRSERVHPLLLVRQRIRADPISPQSVPYMHIVKDKMLVVLTGIFQYATAACQSNSGKFAISNIDMYLKDICWL